MSAITAEELANWRLIVAGLPADDPRFDSVYADRAMVLRLIDAVAGSQLAWRAGAEAMQQACLLIARKRHPPAGEYLCSFPAQAAEIIAGIEALPVEPVKLREGR